MLNSLRVIILFFLIILVALFGCRKDRPHPSWDIDMVTPLFNDTITLFDVINDSLVVENPDQSISLVFDEQLFEVQIDSLVKLPDTLFNWAFGLEGLPYPITLEPGDTIISEVFDWPLDFESFNIEGVKMENAIIRSGEIKFEVYNQSQSALLSLFKINSAVKNETDTFQLEEKVLPGLQLEKIFDFSQYAMNLKGSTGEEFNMLNYSLAFIVHPDELDTIQIHPSDTFAVNVHFIDIVIDYAKGYFGQNTFQMGPEEYNFDLFEDLNLGGFSMNEAEVFLRIENNYGLEGNFNISELTAKNSETGNYVSLQSELLDSNLFVDRATQTGNGLKIIQPTEEVFDFSNSNFNELLNILPDKFAYSMSVETNVLGDSLNYNNFFYYEEPIKVFFEAEINKGVKIEDMYVENRLTWNGSGVSFEKVNKGKLEILFSNVFPFSYEINMYLEDDEFQTLDTLLFDEFISSALLDEDLKVEEAVDTWVSIELTNDLQIAIQEASYVRYELIANSAENEHVKLYADDKLTMKVIGDFQLTVEQ